MLYEVVETVAVLPRRPYVRMCLPQSLAALTFLVNGFTIMALFFFFSIALSVAIAQSDTVGTEGSQVTTTSAASSPTTLTMTLPPIPSATSSLSARETYIQSIHTVMVGNGGFSFEPAELRDVQAGDTGRISIPSTFYLY